jgi:hypothetical protein
VTAEKISYLLADYDGTLAPMDVPRSRSSIPPALESVLRVIARETSLGIITAKSFGFIRGRVPYAAAWACVYGLDIHFSDGTNVTVEPSVDMEGALAGARRMARKGVDFEEKRGASGLIGFSVDWTNVAFPPEISTLISEMSGRGLFCGYEPPNRFADFLCAPPRKGRALERIKAFGRGEGKAMFLGDSSADNPAFRVADVKMGVAHGQNLAPLECEFLTTAADLPRFLKALLDHGMLFEPGLPGIRRK